MTQRDFQPFRRARGFTLVEVMVTTSLFAMAMSILLAGIFSGTRAWDRADRNLEERARARNALEQLREDTEHVQMGTEPLWRVGTDAEGRPNWRGVILETRPGSPWRGAAMQVEWRLAAEGEELAWVRDAQPWIGGEAAAPMESERMVDDVDAIEFQLRREGEWTTGEDPEASQPDLLRVRLELAGGPAFEATARLYPGVALEPVDQGDGPPGEEGGAQEKGSPGEGGSEAGGAGDESTAGGIP